MARLPSWLVASGIAALVVADVALVSLAAMHVRGNDGEADTFRGNSNGSVVPDSESNPPAKDPKPDRPSLVDGPVLLDAAEGGTVLRAARGDCRRADAADRAAVVEISTDGGKTFAQAGLGAPVADVLRVAAGSSADLFVVGADATCALALYSSTDAGSTWEASAGTTGAWHLAWVGGTKVHAPRGPATTGCEVLALSAYSESGARVLCADGRLRGTASGGTAWVGLGSLADAVDIAYENPEVGWALAATADCPASVLRTNDGGVDWAETACVDARGEPQAISAAEGLVAVHVGGEVLTSSDDGATFARP